MRQHLPPPGPVVIYVVTPQVERVRNSLPFQNLRKLLAAIWSFVRTTARKDVDRIRSTKDREEVFVVQAGKIISRIIEIDVIVVIAVQIRLDVVTAAHRNHAAK